MLKQYVEKISFLSYDTIFSAKGSKNIGLSHNACFSRVLNYGYITKEQYVIYLIRDTVHVFKNGY